MVSASHSLRSVFYAFRVGSYEVEKSKRRVISWVDRHICGGACFAGGIELGNERLSLVSYRCFSTVSFLYSCVFYDPEILLWVRRWQMEQTENNFCRFDDEFRNYYRIICESCISEVVLELCVVVYRLCAAHIVYRSFAPFRR